MGSLSPVHWMLVALVVLLLFGPARLAAIGRDVGQGIRSFKKGIDEERAPDDATSQEQSPEKPVAATRKSASELRPN